MFLRNRYLQEYDKRNNDPNTTDSGTFAGDTNTADSDNDQNTISPSNINDPNTTDSSSINDPDTVIDPNKEDHLKNYVLYQKLRELQYKFDDIDSVDSFKDKKALKEFIKTLNNLIIFFSNFTYKENKIYVERLLKEFKGIK
jgi:hypothetical protein